MHASRFLVGIACALLICPTSSPGSEPIDCSIIELIARPEQFAGRRIRTVGFAVIKFENVALYLSASDADHQIDRNAVGLDFTNTLVPKKIQEDVSGHYVIIDGNFRPPPTEGGSIPPYRGTISQIERIVRID